MASHFISWLSLPLAFSPASSYPSLCTPYNQSVDCRPQIRASTDNSVMFTCKITIRSMQQRWTQHWMSCNQIKIQIHTDAPYTKFCSYRINNLLIISYDSHTECSSIKHQIYCEIKTRLTGDFAAFGFCCLLLRTLSLRCCNQYNSSKLSQPI